MREGYTEAVRPLVSSLTLALVVGALVVTAASASTAAGIRPTLTVTTPGAVVVSGTRFRSNERVTLRLVLLGQPLVKIVKTTTAGRLTARFLQDVPECTTFSISAVGNRGSRVLFREIPPPCGIVIQP